MKKFNFKSLLVLVLALILVFSLVACGEKEEDSTPATPPKGFTASDYFGELWKLSSEIGNESIAKTDNLAVSADLELALNIRTSAKVTQALDLGLKINAVLDKTNANGKDTAIKLQVYDPSNSNENWTTIYFFVNDPNYIYFDWAGKNIKLGLELDDGSVDQGNKIHANSYLGTWITNTLSAKEDNNKSIFETIEVFTDNMGSNWSLNTLISDVVKLLNINLTNYLHGVQQDGVTKDETNTIGPMIANVLKSILKLKTVDELFDASGSLDVEKILTSGKLDSLFTASKSADGKTWTASLKSSILSLALNLVGGSLPVDNLSSVIGSKTAIGLSFKETAAGAFESFTLSLGLGDLANSSNGNLYPEIAITLNELKLRKADSSNAVKLQSGKTYSEQFDWSGSVSAKIDGVKLYDEVKGMTYDLTGEYAINLDASVDLKNAAATNKTEAIATITKDGNAVVKAQYAKGTLTVKACEDAKVSATKDGEAESQSVSAAKVLVETFGPWLCQALDNSYTAVTKFEQIGTSAVFTYNEDKYVEATTIYDAFAKYYKEGATAGTYVEAGKVTQKEFLEAAAGTYFTKGAYEEYTGAEITEDTALLNNDKEPIYYIKAIDANAINGVKDLLLDKDGLYIPGFIGQWKNVTLQESAAKLVWDTIDSVSAMFAPDASTSTESNFDLKPVATTVSNAMKYISMAGNKLTIKTSANGLASDALLFGKVWADQFDVDWTTSDDIIKAILDQDGAKEFMKDVTTLIKLDSNATGKDAYYKFFNAIKDSQIEISIDISEAVGTEINLSVVASNDLSVSLGIKATMKDYKAETFASILGGEDTVDFTYDFSLNDGKGAVVLPD